MTSPSEPSYPLDREAFAAALSRGHGRALLHVRTFGRGDFTDEIMDAASNPKSYDLQIDGYREKWMGEMLELAGLAGDFVRLAPPYPDGAARAAILKELASRGVEGARPKLYALCEWVEDWDEVIASEEIVKLDGEKGLVHVVRKQGRALREHRRYWSREWILKVFDNQFGEGRAATVLSEHMGDPDIQRFVDEARRRNDEIVPATRRPSESAPAIRTKILNSEKPVMGLAYWGRRAGDDARLEIFRMFEEVTKPVVIENVLRCFRTTGFPELGDVTLRLLDHPDEAVRKQAEAAHAHHFRFSTWSYRAGGSVPGKRLTWSQAASEQPGGKRH